MRLALRIRYNADTTQPDALDICLSLTFIMYIIIVSVHMVSVSYSGALVKVLGEMGMSDWSDDSLGYNLKVTPSDTPKAVELSLSSWQLDTARRPADLPAVGLQVSRYLNQLSEAVGMARVRPAGFAMQISVEPRCVPLAQLPCLGHVPVD